MSKFFAKVFDPLAEIFGKIQSLCSLVCSYYLPYAFINFKSVHIEDLAPLPAASSRFDNVVPTSEGFVFLLKKNNVYSLAASFAPGNDLILTLPPFATNCYVNANIGLVPQILETTRSANRGLVVYVGSYFAFSTLHITLFEWKNSKWYDWSACCTWEGKVEVRNFVHFADKKTLVFNWMSSENINLLCYHFDPTSESYLFDWKLNRGRLTGLNCNLPLHNFGVYQDRLVVLVPLDYFEDFVLFDLEGQVDFKRSSGSFHYLYNFPYWFPDISRNCIPRLWDVYEKDLVRLDQKKNQITYYNSEATSKYDFPLPSIPYTREDSFEIFLGGLRLFIIRSDKATLLVSPRNSF